MANAGRPATYVPGNVAEQEYTESHPQRLVELMQDGKLDCEIYSEFGITKKTFYLWRNEKPEFAKAFELGFPRCEAWWVTRMRDCWLRGDDKGFKYCISIMNNKFGWGQDEKLKSVVNQQINIEQMNVFKEKSREELLTYIQDALEDNKLIEAQILNESRKEE